MQTHRTAAVPHILRDDRQAGLLCLPVGLCPISEKFFFKKRNPPAKAPYN